MSDPRLALFGRLPRAVIAPGSVAEAQAAVRESDGHALAPWGGGTRQCVGHAPDRDFVALQTERLAEVVDYQPADLTVTVQAGMTVTALQSLLGAQGQWLPLVVAEPERQTVGGVVAARADSLTRCKWGGVRDHLIGVTVINHAGEAIRGGGRVVKNVAGYDLPKLYCGSYGTLGLIAEASFKVAPLPQASATVALPVAAERNCEEILDRLLDAPLEPTFLFLLNPQAAQDCLGGLAGEDRAQWLVVGFDGPASEVRWQVETLGAEPLGEGDAQAVRDRLRDFPHGGAPMTALYNILSSQVGAHVRMTEWTANKAGFAASVAADAAIGKVWAQFRPARPDADWAAFYADFQDKADRVGGSRILTRLPDELQGRNIPVWSPLLKDFALMARLKETLDPKRLWNPGRFVGGL